MEKISRMDTRRVKTAFLFPGQGAQALGMVNGLTDDPASAAIFEKAGEILGYDLLDLCTNGPEDKLHSTVYSQPAIFIVSAVLLDRLRRECPDLTPDVTAGLSMGEYSALYAAGLIEFEDALRLVQKRGQAMQAAADRAHGSMVSILGLDEDKVRGLCDKAAEGQILEPVNFNCPGQIVISGEVEACRRAAQLAESFGAMKAVPLAVAGAFHTSMMAPAAGELKAALETTPIREPKDVRVLANITADYYTSPDEIRSGLVRQLVEPILWQKCMERLLAEGAERFYEIGPGRVLSGLMKRIHRRAAISSINSVESLKELN
jgi:[acyl-carrier-protein] S-malonyltransferase